MVNRIKPAVITGADPDRLGSFGTANVPQITAMILGMPIARTNRNQLSLWFQPHIPKEIKAMISNKNLKIRFAGCDPIEC